MAWPIENPTKKYLPGTGHFGFCLHSTLLFHDKKEKNYGSIKKKMSMHQATK